jgi:putative ABC transport system substrate-binding protein
MKRRAFLTGISATLAAWPRATWSQNKRLPKLGIVGSIGPGAVEALKAGLREAGLIEGQSIAILGEAGRFDKTAVNAVISDLIAKQVDVIFASGTLATQAAREATSSIPIVSVTSDLVAGGFVESLAHPGGNITGLNILAYHAIGKRMEILNQLIPAIARVAILYNPDDTLNALSEASAEAAAARLNIKLQMLASRAESDFAEAFVAAVQANVQAVVVAPNPVLDIGGRRIAELELQYKLPVISYNQTYPRAGGLISYGSVVGEVYKRGAYYIARILAGAKPADLPVEQPTKFNLVINLQRARALDLKIPDTLLASADEVIE